MRFDFRRRYFARHRTGIKIDNTIVRYLTFSIRSLTPLVIALGQKRSGAWFSLAFQFFSYCNSDYIIDGHVSGTTHFPKAKV